MRERERERSWKKVEAVPLVKATENSGEREMERVVP